MTRFVVMLALGGSLIGTPARDSAAQQLLDRVIARVGENAITLTDVQAAIGFGVVDERPDADPVRQMVDRRLVLLELMRRPPAPPDPAAVDAEVARLRNHAGNRLSSLMTSTGIDLDRLRAIARDNLRITAYLQDRFPIVPASDTDAELYYRRNPDEFAREDGTMPPFGEVVVEARLAAAEERRATRIAGWLTTLRNRTDVVLIDDE